MPNYYASKTRTFIINLVGYLDVIRHVDSRLFSTFKCCLILVWWVLGFGPQEAFKRYAEHLCRAQYAALIMHMSPHRTCNVPETILPYIIDQ